jgi:hypothetical protein
LPWQERLDRESPGARNGAYILEVSATEVNSSGVPGSSTTAEITIILEVRR